MSWPSVLSKPVRWLRAGYPDGAPGHGYNPLIALMPGKAADGEDQADADEPAATRVLRPAGEAARRWRD